MPLKQNIKAIFYSTLSALLCFVIVFNLSFNVFHVQTAEHHHASEQTCSADEEFNACHRFLIHNEKSAGCDGTHQHVTNKVDDCFVCKYYKQRSEFANSETCSTILLPEYTLNYQTISFKNKIQNYTSYYLRGPPISA